MTYMAKLKQQEPFVLNAADLVCASPRVDLTYKPLRQVTHERGPVYPGGCVETTPGGTLLRVNTIALELSNHPLVRNHGSAILITHGCPSTHMVKSLCPRPGGMYLPDYADIKVTRNAPLFVMVIYMYSICNVLVEPVSRSRFMPVPPHPFNLLPFEPPCLNSSFYYYNSK